MKPEQFPNEELIDTNPTEQDVTKKEITNPDGTTFEYETKEEMKFGNIKRPGETIHGDDEPFIVQDTKTGGFKRYTNKSEYINRIGEERDPHNP